MSRELHKAEYIGGDTDIEWRYSWGEKQVSFCGPDYDNDMIVTIDEHERGGSGSSVAVIPIEYLANHLRQHGWTVTPPEGSDE